MRALKVMGLLTTGYGAMLIAKPGLLARQLKLPDVPTFFTKAPTAIADPDAVLHLQSRVSSEYDFEAELGIVIGTRCKDVAPKDAFDVVFGYTCVNDVTARDLQRAHVQWFKGKSLDDTCPRTSSARSPLPPCSPSQTTTCPMGASTPARQQLRACSSWEFPRREPMLSWTDSCDAQHPT